MLSKILDPLLSLAYPQSCLVCENSVEQSSDGVACRRCWKKTLVFSGKETLCRKCGKFLSEDASRFETFCHACDDHFYDRASAVGLYEKALRASVLHLKSEPFIARRLQELLLTAFELSEFQDATMIVPVPLSKKRLIERGFNQAMILARFLAKHTGLKLDAQTLARTAHTPLHRAGMDTKAREKTVKNAFEVMRPKFIKDENILLIDDIFTSGATTSACAETLKKKGAGKVYVFTVARAF